MSLDFSLYKTQPTEVFSGNATHNLGRMWHKAGIHDALYESKDKLASSIILFLEAGLEKMKAEPDEYRKLNAPNGWGTYEGAIRFLEEVISACKEYPDAKIYISA